MPRYFGNSWAFKLDYDQEIAADEREMVLYADGGPVARVCDAIALLPPVLAAHAQGGSMAVLAAASTHADASPALFDAVLAALGLARDAALWLVRRDADFAGGVCFRPALVAEAEAALVQLDWTRSEEFRKVVDGLDNFGAKDHAARKALYQKAKAAKARHTRNRTKHGT